MDKFPQVGSLAGFGSTKPRKGKKKPKTKHQNWNYTMGHKTSCKLQNDFWISLISEQRVQLA